MAQIEPATSSGSLTVGTTTVINVPALLCSVSLNPGSAASTVTVYDNASAASGTALQTLVGAASTGSVLATLVVPIYAAKGLTVVVAGTGATATVSYQREA